LFPGPIARRHRRGEVSADGSAVHAHLTCDALDAVTRGASAADLVPARAAARSSQRKILLRLARKWHWRRRSRAAGCLSVVSDNNVLHVTTAAAQELVHRGASIRAEVEAICDLDRLGCPLSSSFGIGTSSIADNDLDTGVAAQPVGEDFGSAIVEQVDRPMRLEVEQQGAIPPLLASKRNVINAKHSRTMRLFGVGERVEQPEERIWADWHARFARQTSATFAASLQGERRQQLGRAVGAPGVVGQYTIQALSEDLPWAIWHIAEPPSAVDS
jgi:hypothetical protein